MYIIRTFSRKFHHKDVKSIFDLDSYNSFLYPYLTDLIVKKGVMFSFSACFHSPEALLEAYFLFLFCMESNRVLFSCLNDNSPE